MQIISAESGSFPALEDNLSDALKIEPDQVQPLGENNGDDEAYKENIEGKSHDGQTTTTTTKVTELHDPLNILEKIHKTDTVHSHSITSEDFAQVTSFGNSTSQDKSPPETIPPKLDGNEDEDNPTLLLVPVQDIPMDEIKLIQDLPANGFPYVDFVDDGSHTIQINTLNITELFSSTDNILNEKSRNESVRNEISEDSYDASSNVSDESSQRINFTDLVNKVKDEIKTYSNEAVIAWEDLKERVSSDNEASHVLNDYHDKIKISQAVNRSECVEVHVEKYERRMQFLKNVMQSCESNLKRERWHELQNRTKLLLNAINEIARETNIAEENLLKDAGESYVSVESIESEGRRKLKSLGVEDEKQGLSGLKKTALNTDEDEYRDCIFRNTGHDIIVDTLNDIMKIKNNCVG